MLKVSIPFKREGLSEQQTQESIDAILKFQFPSNGKVFLNSNYILISG